MANVAVHKVTLKTGKIVIVKDLDMRDEENATLIASKKAVDQPMAFSIFFLNELTKLLILEIDTVKITANDKLQIERLLTRAEFNQVRQAVGSLMGEDQALPQIETEVTGAQSPG
jgi:3,4-dihydroxy-2-butanone 4-phosphate synthase